MKKFFCKGYLLKTSNKKCTSKKSFLENLITTLVLILVLVVTLVQKSTKTPKTSQCSLSVFLFTSFATQPATFLAAAVASSLDRLNKTTTESSNGAPGNANGNGKFGCEISRQCSMFPRRARALEREIASDEVEVLNQTLLWWWWLQNH